MLKILSLVATGIQTILDKTSCLVKFRSVGGPTPEAGYFGSANSGGL
ncbi:MAG TPA: hypothetical protein VG009_02730 [Candidatus Dormibacteraeota bacterium]|nr:hypothetical protein [Candidatus Dormibacteraeota bacterium]